MSDRKVVCLMVVWLSLSLPRCSPAETPKLPIVENLITRTETVELSLVENAPQNLFRKGPCVIVLGLVCYSGESPDFEILDFELQSQDLANPKVKPDDSRWEKIDVKESIKLLSWSNEIQAYEDIGVEFLDSTISMPLPVKQQGKWGECVVHPKLAEKANQRMNRVLLFRYIDFHPERFKNHIYRVRLTVKKPEEKIGNLSPWSEVSVPAKDEHLLPK